MTITFDRIKQELEEYGEVTVRTPHNEYRLKSEWVEYDTDDSLIIIDRSRHQKRSIINLTDVYELSIDYA